MKQWLMILAMLWAAATVSAAAEGQSRVTPAQIKTSVLSPGEETHVDTEEAPLLATAGTRTSQLLGTEQVSGKGGRQSEHTSAGYIHNDTAGHDLRIQQTNLHNYEPCSPGIRATDRYIYFLRRIII